MLKKVYLALSLLLLVGIFIRHSEARVSDQEWREMFGKFIAEYDAPKAQKDAMLRIKALRALARADHPQLVKLFASKVIPFELNQKDTDSLFAIDLIAQILGQLEDQEAIEQLIHLTKKTLGLTRTILVRGMGRIHKDVRLSSVEALEITTALIEYISDKTPQVQIAAMDGLAASCPKEALPAVIKVLNSKHWEVRASAINYLARVRDDDAQKQAIEALRKRRDKESGRLKYDISQAINTLCGSASDTGADSAPGMTIAKFYGVKIESENIIFVVDISGSMLGPAKETEWEREEGDEVAKKPKKGKEKQGLRKIDVLRKELIKAINKLAGGARPVSGYATKKRPDNKFNIITFHDEVKVWKKELVSARQCRDEAIKWVKNNVKTRDPNQPIGQTNLYDALELAFGLTKKTKKPISGYFSSKGETDTIFLMSDGMPNVGKYTQPGEILSAIRVLNQSRKIKINTIAVGVGGTGGLTQMAGANTGFMKQLAEENNGTYVGR